MFDIAGAIEKVSSLGETIITRIWPDATEIEKEKVKRVAQEMQAEFQLLLGQLKINEIEAGSDHIFKSGWRPAVGWTCAASLFYVALIEPFARFIAVVIFSYTGIFPAIDTNLTMQILMGLLGLAGYRTYEKSKGISK